MALPETGAIVAEPIMSTINTELPPGPVGWHTRRTIHVLLVLTLGLLMFAYRYLSTVADRGEPHFQRPLIDELTAACVAGTLFLGVRQVARRRRLDGPDLRRNLASHVAAVLLFAVLSTSLMWASRSLVFALFGLGRYDYGRMPHRYFMEFPVQLVIYALMVAGVHASERSREARARLLRAAQLESQLSRARLQNLELQLQPHFLFNALNTISSAMYEDPRAADEMLGHLAELLRAALRTQQAHELPLREELLALDHYLALMRARFGEQLAVAIVVPTDTLDLCVPPLILQPLVENAVRHGGAEALGHGRVEISARREGADLVIEVRDDGPGTSPAPRQRESGDGAGLGLALTRERLALLYGQQQAFEAAPEGSGFRVRLRLPARRAETRA